MNHMFSVKAATEIGINESIILTHLHFWIKKNKANERHYLNGNWWTYNSTRAFAELFPYMTERVVAYTLNKLTEQGYIIKDYFNSNPYDRTSWYAMTKKGYEAVEDYETAKLISDYQPEENDEHHLTKSLDGGIQNCNMEEQKSLNAILQNCKMNSTNSLNVNTYINTNNKQQIINNSAKSTSSRRVVKNQDTNLEKLCDKVQETKQKKTSSVSKSDKWLDTTLKIFREYDLSDKLQDSLEKFLVMLTQINSLLPEITIRSQIDNLVNKIKLEQDRISIVDLTVSKGWKSLDYMIDTFVNNKYNNKTFDTAGGQQVVFRTEQEKIDLANRIQQQEAF